MSTFYQQHHGTGSWDLELLPNTPRSILNRLHYNEDTGALGWFGHLIVTPTWVPAGATSTANLLAMSIYTGVYQGRANVGTRMRGYGLASWLGTSDGMTDVTESSGSFTKTVDNWIDDHVLTDTGSKLNGITKGDVSASATTYERAIALGITRMEILRRICDRAEMEWRINHDASLDVDTEANLYASSAAPTLVLDAETGGRDFNLNGVYSVFSDEADVERFVTDEIVEADDGNAYGWHEDPPFYDLQGELILRQHYTSDPSTPFGAAASLAADLLVRYSNPVGRRRFTVQCPDLYDARAFVEPGDTVFVNHPELDLWAESNQTSFRGAPIHPVPVRVYGLRQPSRHGFGYYFRDSDSAGTVIDLTEYVKTDESPVVLEVGAVRRSLRVL